MSKCLSHARHQSDDNIFLHFVFTRESSNVSIDRATLAIVLDGGDKPSAVGRLLLEDNRNRQKSVWLLEDSQESLDIISAGGAPFNSKIFLARVASAGEDRHKHLYLREVYKVRERQHFNTVLLMCKEILFLHLNTDINR